MSQLLIFVSTFLSGFWNEAHATGSFSCIMGSLAETESSGRYHLVGPQTRYGRALGRYQFLPSNVARYTGLSAQQFLASPAAQERAMERMLADNWAYAQRNGLDQHIGREFNYRVRTNRGFNGPLATATLTREGLLAAMHLGGPRSVERWLAGRGNAADNLGTSVASYAGHHGTNCGGTSGPGEGFLGAESDAEFSEAMNWDDCFDWVEPSFRVVGVCGGLTPAPEIEVTFEYTEPPVMVEAVTEAGKSAIEGIPGVRAALQSFGAGGRSGANLGANLPGSGHIARAFFEAHVWGLGPKARFESSGAELDVKKSLACDLADELETWENAYTPVVKLQQLSQQDVQNALSNWTSKWFNGVGQGALEAAARNGALGAFGDLARGGMSGVSGAVARLTGTAASGAGSLAGLGSGSIESHINQMLGQAGGLLDSARGGGFNPLDLARLMEIGVSLIQQVRGDTSHGGSSSVLQMMASFLQTLAGLQAFAEDFGGAGVALGAPGAATNWGTSAGLPRPNPTGSLGLPNLSVPSPLDATEAALGGAGRSSPSETVPIAHNPALGGQTTSRPASALISSIPQQMGRQRDDAILQLIRSGHVAPDSVNLLPVVIDRGLPPGVRSVTFGVGRDYIAVGSTDDRFRVPLGADAAVQAAAALGGYLPTRGLVDAIYAQGQPIAFQAQSPGPHMTTTDYARQHDRGIDRRLAGADPSRPLAGMKKDIIVGSGRAGRVTIYGAFDANGRPIQPVSNVHSADYADYSHGARLVGATALVTMTDGSTRSVNVADLYADPAYTAALGMAGPVSVARVDGSGSSIPRNAADENSGPSSPTDASPDNGAPTADPNAEAMVVPLFLSEMHPSTWRANEEVTQQEEVGVWGPLHPRNGVVPTTGANNIRSAALAAYRSYTRAEPNINSIKREPESKPNFNLDYPHRSRCHAPGTADARWESRDDAAVTSPEETSRRSEGGHEIEDGKYLFTYWKKSKCAMRVCTANWRIISNTWHSVPINGASNDAHSPLEPPQTEGMPR